MKRSFAAFILGVFLVSAVSTAAVGDSPAPSNGYGQPIPSKDLIKVLAQIQKLDQGGMLGLHVWAGYSRPQPSDPPLTPLDDIETAIIFKLSPSERDAMLSWARHGDRSELLALGVSNADIGPCVDSIDRSDCNAVAAAGGATNAAASSTTTSAAFHDLPFTVAAGNNQDGGISIERGFAIVKNDATSETHCLTFKNVGAKKVDALTFVYKLHAQNGEVVFAGSNLRAGNFESGQEVAGPASAPDLGTLRSDGPDKMLLNNCWTKSTKVATPGLLRAAYMTIGVASVTYDDGTHWALGQ